MKADLKCGEKFKIADRAMHESKRSRKKRNEEINKFNNFSNTKIASERQSLNDAFDGTTTNANEAKKKRISIKDEEEK